MARHGENIHKRKDGRWEGRYIKGRSETGKAIWGYVYAYSYVDAKTALQLITRFRLGHKSLHFRFFRNYGFPR